MKKQEILQQLEGEKERLSIILSDAENRLKQAPEGSVRIIKHGNGYQYYYREKRSDKNGVYLPVSERDKVTALIQKKYDMQVRDVSQKQVAVIDRFLKSYEPDILKDIHSALPEVRRKQVVPVELSDSEYEKRWEETEFVQKEFDQDAPEHYTSKGERVRSKSEVMIADTLYRMEIPYKYECPLNIGYIALHPDFTILRHSDRAELYWEHLGMMDDAEYCNNALKRIRMYESNGIYPGNNLILTMETQKVPINVVVIEKIIREYCM